MPETIAGDRFEPELETRRTVVAEFSASWCSACRASEPELVQLAERHPRIRFVSVDVDEAPELAARLGVVALPTVVRFDSGHPTVWVQGALPARELAQRLQLPARRPSWLMQRLSPARRAQPS